MDTEAMAERARIVAWLREPQDQSKPGWYGKEHAYRLTADAIERGDHDYPDIPRMTLGVQAERK